MSISTLKNRTEIVHILYNVSKKFFSVFGHPNTNLTFKEVGLDEHLRCDILNLGWDDKVVIMELKTCKEDFKTDNKWKNYLNYCNYFFFVCPTKVISQEDIPKDVGLMWVDIERQTFRIVQRPKKLKPLKITNSWLHYIHKKLLFRKYVKVSDKVISLENDKFF